MPTVGQSVRTMLARGELTPASPIIDVPGIGPYLADRLARACGAPPPLTVGGFWTHTRRRSTATVQRLLARALQNERGNQCVSPHATGGGVLYHTGDINEHGYRACAALLAASPHAVRYGHLPSRMRVRASSCSTA